jgi:VIT1/CCC1 family predicted Fe2+/Mn2+ transporter
VKYCPYLSCPHRRRVRAPAEFMGHVSVCSDCGTPLVDSESEAREGIRELVSAKIGPYRQPGPHAIALRSDEESRARTDKLVGASFLFGALLVLIGSATYSLSWMAAWCAGVYGVVRLVRGFSAARREN